MLLRRLLEADGIDCRLLSGGRLAALRSAFLSEYLRPCAIRQGEAGDANAESDRCTGEPGGSQGEDRPDYRATPSDVPKKGRRVGGTTYR